MEKTFVFSVSLFLLTAVASLVFCQGTNIAIGQNASQLQTLVYNGFNWTADRVVDNCTLQDDPDNQQCCGASTDIGNGNYIRVDFDKVYNLSSIVVYGRGDTETQTKDFRVYIVNESGLEVLVYDNTCCDYGNGIFTIPWNDTAVLSIVLTRPNTGILTVCEIQAFQTLEPVTPGTTLPSTIVTTTTASVTSATINTTTSLNANTTTVQGQSTSQSQMPSSTEDQTGQTTGDPSAVSGIFRHGEVIALLLLSVFFVLKSI